MHSRLGTTRSINLRGTTRKSLYLTAWFALLPCAIYGQAAQDTTESVANAIAQVKQGHADMSAIDEIARAKAVQGIPALEEQFARTENDTLKDGTLKDKIANALVKLGDKDDTYWDYLLEQATVAVESDAPDPIFDSQGKVMPKHLSPQFIAWANAHNVSADSAAQNALFVLPGKVMLLGETGDPRGIPLLRRALWSPNYEIEAAAAEGLAQAQDKAAIPLIIQACQRAPADAASAIASSLVYFNDPDAQAGVDTYVPKDRAKALRDAVAHGKKPFGY